MAVNIKTGVKEYSYFPESHYSGVTIEIDFAVIETNPNVMSEELHLTPQFLLKLIIYFFARIHNQCFFSLEKYSASEKPADFNAAQIHQSMHSLHIFKSVGEL